MLNLKYSLLNGNFLMNNENSQINERKVFGK